MKLLLSITFTLLFFITAISQEVFDYDKYGFVSDNNFHELIKDRGYELVGNFQNIGAESKKIYAKILKNGKWGFLNLKGQEIIEPNYTMLSDFKNGVSIASFEIILPMKAYDDVAHSGIEYGLINENGLMLTNQKYDFIKPFHNDYAIAYKNNKYGIINKNGGEVVDFLYDEIQIDDNFWFVSKDNKWGLIKTNGELIYPYNYDYIKRFNGFLLGYKNNKFTILNPKTGIPLNKSWYDDSNLYDKNTIRNNSKPTNSNVLVVKQNDSFFLINKRAKRISDNYNYIIQESKKYFRIHKGKKSGIINDKGNIRSKLNFYSFGITYDENIFYSNNNGKTYYYTKDFKKIPLPPSITYGPNFKNGLGLTGFDTIPYKAGFVNSNGKLVIPAIYDGVSTGFKNKKEALVRKNLKWGVINRKGKTIIPFKYDYIIKIRQGYIITIKEKQGVIDSKNNILVPAMYQSISNVCYNNKNYIVRLNNKFGIINSKNEIILPIEYDRFESNICFSEGLLKVKKNNLYGFINYEGNVIIPIQYQYVDDFSNGFAICEYNDNEVTIDKYGNIYWR